MNMNLGQLTAAILEQVEKVSGPCSADIRRYINDALLELASEVKTITRGTVAISSGEGDLPDNCLFPQSVYVNGAKIYQYAEDSVFIDKMGDPVYWLIDGSKIKTIPEWPSGSLELVYIEKAAELVDDHDTHNIPYADKFVIAYGIWKAILEADGPSNEAGYWQAETEREREMWKKIDRRAAKRPRVIKPPLWR